MRKNLTSRKCGVRTLRVEKLEGRDLLAGGWSTPMPRMAVVSQAVPVADILPGATDVVLGRDTFAALAQPHGRVNKARLVQIDLLPAEGSDQLRGNLQNVEVWANLKGGVKAKDGPRNDGYETFIASGSPDQYDVISLSPWKTIWAGKNGVQVEYVGRFSNWLNGNTIGLETELATFCDLRGNYVPDWNVFYKGAEPTLHTLENDWLEISQQPTDKYGSALAGQDDVELLRFGDWRRTSEMSQAIAFTASQGDMANIQSFSLVAYSDWNDSAPAQILQSDVVPVNGKLTFNITSDSPMGELYAVRGNVADTLVADPHLQLLLDPSGISATNTQTGKALRGVVVNGSGAGQIRVYTSQQAPLFTFANNDPTVTVSEVTASDQFMQANPGDDVLLESFVFSTVKDTTLLGVTLVAAQGSFENFVNFTLQWDVEGDGQKEWSVGHVETLADGSTCLVFKGFTQGIKAGTALALEVHADAADSATYGWLRTQLAGDAGITASAVDNVFLQYSKQPVWYIGTGGPG